jgi:molybdopterin-containing oxidoreductase family iron-sulfur binding subunit
LARIFLGTWNSAVAHSAAYGRMRQGRGNVRPKFVHVDARLSQTAANADEFVACKPGTEGLLALAIAGDETPQTASERTGVPVATIERLTREFAAHGPSVAIIGGAPLAHTNGLFHALAVNRLNQVAKTVNQPGGVSFVPRPSPATARPLKEIVDTPPKLLLIDDVNPVFGSPGSWKVADALSACRSSSASDRSSTRQRARDLILPDHSFLESWVMRRRERLAKAPVEVRPVMRRSTTPIDTRRLLESRGLQASTGSQHFRRVFESRRQRVKARFSSKTASARQARRPMTWRARF